MRRLTVFVLLSALFLHGSAIPTVAAQEPAISYVTRGEAVTLILKNSKQVINPDARVYGLFPDVVDGNPQTPYILKAIELGMLKPEVKTNYIYPLRSVSRSEFLFMMSLAYQLQRNVPYQYTDIPSDAWYRPYIGIAHKYRLFWNTSNPNALMPNLRVSHTEAAQTVFTIITELPDKTIGSQLLHSSASSAPTKLVFSAPTQPEPTPTPAPVITQTVQPITVRTEPDPQVVQYIAYPPLYPSAPVFEATPAPQPEPNLYISTSTPTLVKSALLKFAQSQGNTAATIKNKIIQLVNAERAVYNLPPLKENYYLELAAQRHAKDMYDRGYFSHFTPEGKNYVDRIRDSGYLTVNPDSCTCTQQFTLGVSTEDILETGPNHQTIGTEDCSCTPIYALGENIARGQITPEEVMEDWMASPTHRENILRKSFEEIGIGIFGDVWSQEFGRLEIQ